MKIAAPITSAVTLGLLATIAPAAHGGQSRSTVGELLPSQELPKPLTGTILCRGGPAMVWERTEVEDLTRAPSKAKRQMIRLIFQLPRGPAGPQGLGLKPSECGFVDKPWPTNEYAPSQIYFDAANATFETRSGVSGVVARRSTIQEYLSDINHFWSFDVVLKTFYFDAETHRRFDTSSSGAVQVPILTEARNTPGGVKAKAVAKGTQSASSAAQASENTSATQDSASAAQPAPVAQPAPETGVAPSAAAPAQADDRGIIIVGGKETGSANETASGTTGATEIQGASTAVRSRAAVLERSQATAPSNNVLTPKSSVTTSKSNLSIQQSANMNRVSELKMECESRPPRIHVIRGRVAAGEQFTIEGACLGGYAGAVELMGRFSGGVLKPQIILWQTNAVVAALPRLSGVPDHPIAVTLVRAPDGKRSPAKQANFLAAREIVDVPSYLWRPNYRFQATDVGHVMNAAGPPAKTYTTKARLAVDSVCALESVDAVPSVGDIDEIKGWGAGPPHIANVEIVARAPCERRITTAEKGVIEAALDGGGSRHKYTRSDYTCKFDFELRARASCPVGLTPW